MKYKNKNKNVSGQVGSKRSSISKSSSLVGAATVAALVSAGAANGQQSEPDSSIEEVVVTGSMIRRDGYETPAPVSVLGEEALSQMPVTQIGEVVERMPAFQGSQNSRNNVSISDGTSGTNLLNLRGLGANRTLVLLDGKRVVGASIGGDRGGAVDISNFPSGLVERVEVNTGGASAVYGSDALAGVVNFILNKDYTGFKVRAQGSSTTHGDGEAYQAGFTGGMSFADGRGHFLVDFERGYDAAIEGKPRDWAEDTYALIRNPAYAGDNSQPQYTTIEEAGLSVATRGGVIVSGPLRGTQFQAGGTPLPYDFGRLQSGVWQSGGDWQTSRIDQETGLALEQTRDNVFLRASFDITDSTSVYAEMMRGYSRSDNPGTALPFQLGNVTIYSGNPFIPSSVQAAMDAQGLTNFRMGTVNGDAGQIRFAGERNLERYVLGIEGDFDAFGSDWDWEASYVNNQNETYQATPNNLITGNYTKAVDAVVNDQGQTVCRVNADADTSNDDPACVAYNNMGTGVLSPAAHDYAFGTGWMNQLLEQEVMSASVAGEPIDTWAGPVSLAFGAAYRTEEVSASSSELDQQTALLAGNYNPTFGEYDVTEYYAETVIPLAKDMPFIQQLDVNGAVRMTDYSTSGEVTTWKVGVSWRLNDELRLRTTQSRDIRAPNLGNLFDAGTSGTGTTTDPFLNVETQTIGQTRGNPDVQPEIGDTTGIGFVYQPSWMPGLAMSVDYYNIEISDAILTIGGQEVVDRCFEGDAILCKSVQRGADGFIDLIVTQPQNLLSQETAGYDVEASYLFPLSSLNTAWDGELSLRAMVTIVDKLDSSDGKVTIDGAGVTGPSIGNPGFGLDSSKVRYLTTLSYLNGPLDVTLTARGMGENAYNKSYLECVPGSCPAATATRPTVNDNEIDAITYFDLNFNYQLDNGRVFFSAQNVLDQDPPRVATTSFWSGPGSMQYYDRMGRIIRVGVNFEF
tara:strand:- start:3834 stop:6731 length:2898 start_codon:yes stop_codon:yes gene_type:complete